MNSSDCIFCKIINKEIPAEFIYEDDEFAAFLDIQPKAKGHALLVPKQHLPNILESSDEMVKNLAVMVKKLVPKILSSNKADGFQFVVNTGAAAGQTVFHLHAHIIPKYN